MKALILTLCAAVCLISCSKTESTASQNDAPIADFENRIRALKAAKIEGAVLSEIQHDVAHTNSSTARLSAKITLKKSLTVPGPPSVYDLTVIAHYRDGAWHYEKCTGVLHTRDDNSEAIDIKIDENAFKVGAAYDVVKAIHLKHQDPTLPQELK